MGSEHVKTLMQMKNVEIVGENGKLVFENETLTLCKNEISMLHVSEPVEINMEDSFSG